MGNIFEYVQNFSGALYQEIVSICAFVLQWYFTLNFLHFLHSHVEHKLVDSYIQRRLCFSLYNIHL